MQHMRLSAWRRVVHEFMVELHAQIDHEKAKMVKGSGGLYFYVRPVDPDQPRFRIDVDPGDAPYASIFRVRMSSRGKMPSYRSFRTVDELRHNTFASIRRVMTVQKYPDLDLDD